MLTAIILSLIFTAAGSRWIDYLYKLPNAPLTFPEEIESRSKLRKPLFALLLFVNLYNLADIPAPLYFYLTAIIFFLSMITFTDFEQYVIFDKMLTPFALIAILAAIHLNLPLIDRIIAAFIGSGIFFFISVITKGGIGGGDVKLIFVLGLWLGTDILLDVVIKACIFGGVVALIMILTKQKSRTGYFAYGPYFTLTAMYILSCAKNL
jgi:leader peptidase (prepilin peptidase)/N-methyltransferase